MIDHAAKIREIVEVWIDIAERQDMLGVLEDITQIPPHLDALQAELDTKRARVNRLRGYALVLEVKFAEEAGISDAEAETIRPYYLQPGDLPDDEEVTT